MDEPMNVGDWVRVSILGSGGFGIVALWKNHNLNEYIAVKMCKSKLPSNLSKRQRERWMEEVEFMRKIRNANIVSYKPLPAVLEATLNKHNPSNLPLLSMEYCSKGNLRHLLSQYENTTGLHEMDVRYILRDMLNAISHLHELNITHRDLKPENIVLDKCDSRPTKVIYKLIDLGYAKELDSVAASFVGTLQYLAPEIFQTEKYDSTVDYWSFGIVTYEIICGTHPFLPHLPPAERFKYIERKSPEDICIYKSRSGEFKYTSEIVFENHISPALKKNLEHWLRGVLQYDPKQRVSTFCTIEQETNTIMPGYHDGNVFIELLRILNLVIIGVFSVFNYQWYHYEVDSSTLMSRLQEWLERDTGVKVPEQMILTENVYYTESKDRRIADCFDELTSNSLVVLLKKNTTLPPVRLQLPTTITRMYDAPSHQHHRENARALYANGAHYIAQERVRLVTFGRCVKLYWDYVRNLFEHEETLYCEVRKHAQKMLGHIESYSEINERLKGKLTQQDPVELACCLRQSRLQMQQSRELLEIVNGLTNRHVILQKRKSLINESGISKLENSLETDKIGLIYNKMKEDWSRIHESLDSMTCAPILRFVNQTIKLIYETTGNESLSNYLKISWKLHREMSRLIKWMDALKSEIVCLTQKICTNECDLLLYTSKSRTSSSQGMTSSTFRNAGATTSSEEVTAQSSHVSFIPPKQIFTDLSLSITVDELLDENISLRYSIHELILEGISKLNMQHF